MTLKTVKSMKSARRESAPRAVSHSAPDEAKTAEPSGALGFIDLFEVEGLLPGTENALLRARQIGARVDAVVLRPLPKAICEDAELLERVRNEMGPLVQLRHPHVVSLLGFHRVEEVRYRSDAAQARVGVDPGDWLLVAAFAPGVSLEGWRSTFLGGRVPLATAVEMVRQICGALDYAHRRKMFHLDLKPSNVIVEAKNGDRFTARVMDFCPAPERAAFDEGAGSYAAPELRGTAAISQAADQYAVAMLFLELVTGNVDRASIDQLAPKVRRVVSRALAENASDRFPSCGAFSRALELAGTRKGRTPMHYALLAVLSCVAAFAVWRSLPPSAGTRRAVAETEAKARQLEAEARRRAAEAAESARLENERKLAAEKAAQEERVRFEETRRVAELKAAAAAAERRAAEKARQAELETLERKAEAERVAAERASAQKAAELQLELERAAEERRQATARAHARFRAKDWTGTLAEARKGDLGDPELQWEVGSCLLDGLGTTTNLAGAVAWIRKAADQAFPPAQVRLGKLMEEGRGVVSNAAGAVALFRAAAARGDLAAHWELARCLEQVHGSVSMPDEAVRHLELAARGGHSRAQYALGLRCADVKMASAWLLKSAERGYAPAQVKYGDCLSSGKGVARNLEQAAAWYRRAADQGNAEGQRALGLCYDNGLGVKEDGRHAAELYRDAATGGDLLAKALYSQCLFLGLGGVPHDGDAAWRLARASADGGCAFGQYMAGLCCETGVGTIRSRLNAKEWYEKAIRQGLACARERLDRMQIK